MKPPEQVLRELVQHWIAKRWIIGPRSSSSRARSRSGRRHQIEFPKTHNVRLLLDLASTLAPDLAASLEPAVALTPYGVDVRYPGDFPDVLPGQDAALFEVATAVREAVLARLQHFLNQS